MSLVISRVFFPLAETCLSFLVDTRHAKQPDVEFSFLGLDAGRFLTQLNVTSGTFPRNDIVPVGFISDFRDTGECVRFHGSAVLCGHFDIRDS